MPKKTEVHTYQLLTAMCMYTTVTVGREQVNIHFKNGFNRPYVRRGTYSTDNPDIIRALESDASYNVEWKKIAPLSAEKGLVNVDGDTDTTGGNPDKEVNDDLVKVPGIDSGQKARAYILSKYDEVKTSDLRTNADIKAVAEQNGISFPDWVEQ